MDQNIAPIYSQHAAGESVESFLLPAPAPLSSDLDDFLTGEDGSLFLDTVEPNDVVMQLAALKSTLSIVSVDSVPLSDMVTLSLSGLRSMIDTHPSLEKARIISIMVCKERMGRIEHRFIVLELWRDYRKTVWLRIDRKSGAPKPRFKSLFAFSSTTPRDIAYLAADREKLVGSAEAEYESKTSSHPPPTLGVLQHLLRIVCDELQRLQASQIDAWLFCALLQQNLEQLSEHPKDLLAERPEYAEQAQAVSKRVKDRLKLLRPLSPSSVGSSSMSALSVPGVLLLTVKQFCSDPLFAGDAHIRILKRFKYSRGLKHEFIIAGAQSSHSNTFWIRIDRAAALDSSRPSYTSFSSNFAAKDSIRIAQSESDLLQRSAEVTSKSTVSFSAESTVARRPTVRDLAQVVGAIGSVSPNYSLLTENCYFVSSIIQEALTEMFAGALKGDPPTWAQKHAKSATRDILLRLAESN